MKAARLNTPGEPLQIEETQFPPLHPDGVIVKVLSSHMMSYTDEVLGADESRIPPPVPYTPGLSATAVIEQVGQDVSGLAPGDFVFCNPHVVDSAPGRDPEMILIGWFGITPGADRLLQKWKNGSFAEYAAYPASCVTPIDPSWQAQHATLAHLNILTVAHGALRRGAFQPGSSVIINGITGNIGASTALLALALGAEQVIGLGRDLAVMQSLTELDERIECVPLSGDTQADTEVVQAVSARTNLCIDASAAGDSSSTEVALSSLGYGGTAVWVGGVRADIPVPYFNMLIKELKILGSYMYGPDCPAQLIRMIEAGVLSLEPIQTRVYSLDQINQAIAEAPQCKGLSSVVIQPN